MALISSGAPWRELTAELDEIGVHESGAPVSALDEADAMVTCGWRYGSYAHLLCGGEIIRVSNRNEFSWIDNDEMMRLNLEFSAAAADWLADRGRDPERIARRVRTVFKTLPVTWAWEGGVSLKTQQWLGRDGMDAAIRSGASDAAAILHSKASELAQGRRLPTAFAEQPMRAEANYLVNHAYRNGEIENVHAGALNPLVDVPGFVRLTAAQLNQIAGETSRSIAFHLVMREMIEPDLLALYMANSYEFPDRWSLTEETSNVEFDWADGAPSPAARLRELKGWFPVTSGA